MGFAIVVGALSQKAALRFQFPFHRDGLCDVKKGMKASQMTKTFSSLFIGMGFAMINSGLEKMD